MSYPSCVCTSEDIDDLTYADVRRMAKKNSCRLCRLSVKVLEAFADEALPALFQGARDRAQRAEILKGVYLETYWAHPGVNHVDLLFRGAAARILIYRESDEGSAFTVRGVSFPEGEVVSAPLPLFSNRHYPERRLERARSWLRQCLDQHSCGKSDFYPKRLLNLREDPIRLFQTNETKHFKEPYVCLSHRWGDAKHKRLTSTVANIHNHMKGIAWDEIPKTFQDAIMVCRRMSVSYLWIDTVCILQAYSGMAGEDAAKTRADFAAENSAMARIYQNSQFTICASMSTSMDSGIYPPRTKDHPIKVTGDKKGSRAILRLMAEPWHAAPPTDLETRGWTYQEYLLPPRILEFGPVDISWRCQKDLLCECADRGLKSYWGWREVLAKQARPPKNVKSEAVKWWETTVRHYTARNLTNHQDKLPALSGLAQIYHEVTHDIYLAGLWKASLPHNLCWYQCGGEDAYDTAVICVGRRPQAYRAPSWSWASIDSDALRSAQCRTWWPDTVVDWLDLYDEYLGGYLRELCTIYEVDVKPKTGDPFGEVAPGGFIQLGVTLISAKIDTNIQSAYSHRFNEVFSGSVAWTLNDVDEEDADVVLCLPDCGLEDDGLQNRDEVHCAPIHGRVSGWRTYIGCLVLKRLRDQEYRRVGFCILAKGHTSSLGKFAKDAIPELTRIKIM